MEIAAKALRSRVGQVLACLDRGESVTITYRGKPRAKLVGIDADREEESRRNTDFPAFGMWRGPRRSDRCGRPCSGTAQRARGC